MTEHAEHGLDRGLRSPVHASIKTGYEALVTAGDDRVHSMAFRGLVALYLGERKAVPPVVRARLVQHSAPWVRHAIAVHPETGAEDLQTLASDRDAFVRAAVARRTETPAVALLTLAHDPSTQVRAAIAANARAPLGALVELFGDPDTEVCNALCARSEHPPEIRRRLALHPRYVAPRERLNGEPEVPPDAPAFILVGREGTAHPSYPVPWLPERVHDRDDFVSHLVAGHPFLDRACYEALVRATYGGTRTKVARDPKIPGDLLLLLTMDPVSGVRGAAAANPCVAAEALERVLAEQPEDDDDDPRIEAASNPAASQSTLRRLARVPTDYVRRAVAKNPSTPADLIEALARDPSGQARWGVTWNPKTPRMLLELLSKDPDEKTRNTATWRLAAAALAAAHRS
jgi:hypothetical protein